MAESKKTINVLSVLAINMSIIYEPISTSHLKDVNSNTGMDPE